jgi:hypothetical protein
MAVLVISRQVWNLCVIRTLFLSHEGPASRLLAVPASTTWRRGLSPLRFCEELSGFLRSQFLSPRQFVIFLRIFVFLGVFGFLGFLWLCHHHRGRASLGRIGLAGRNDMERPRHCRGGIEPGVGDAPPTCLLDPLGDCRVDRTRQRGGELALSTHQYRYGRGRD